MTDEDDDTAVDAPPHPVDDDEPMRGRVSRDDINRYVKSLYEPEAIQ